MKMRLRCNQWAGVRLMVPVSYRSMSAERPEVRGVDLDAQTRCAHYRSERDILAIKMKCCGIYYACKDCHDAVAGHAIKVWPRDEWNEPAALCGACGQQMSIAQYMEGGYKCPACGAAFNPACRNHYHFYFAR